MIRPRREISMVLVFILIIKCCNAIELPTTIIQLADGGLTNISLSTYNKSSEKDQAFTQLVSVDKYANFMIKVNDIPAEVAFIIIQIHSYLYNVSMSYDESLIKESGTFVTGTNIGLFVDTDEIATTFVYVTNENNFEIGALIAVVAYKNDAPYPGGCNMEFEVEKSPFQKLVYDQATITVDAQPASLPKIGTFQPLCEKYPLRHDVYRMYMPEQDFSNETYFYAISNMLTVSDITKNANFIPQSLYGSAMRRVYSLYPGTGSVYGMVARFTNHSSAYVPIVTYGCDPTSWFDSCTILTTSSSKVLCALMFFLGLFLAMRGHYYFKISMFLIGLMLGGYIGYTIGSAIETLSVEGTIMTAVMAGIFTSLIWLLLWLTLSSPIPSLILSSLALGSFSFYVFYFTIPAGVLYLEVDVYFWMLLVSFIAVSFLIFSVIPLVANILCFTMIGAYATIFSIDYYSGSNLKYLLVNGIRRTVYSNFNVAIIQPPYQDKDISLTFFWVFLVIIGLYKQCATSWNRAPFPPQTNYIGVVGENAPLLGGRRYRIRHKSFYSRYNQGDDF